MTYWLVYISIMVCIVLPLVSYVTLKQYNKIAKRINDDLRNLEKDRIESEFKKFTTKKNKTKTTQ